MTVGLLGGGRGLSMPIHGFVLSWQGCGASALVLLRLYLQSGAARKTLFARPSPGSGIALPSPKPSEIPPTLAHEHSDQSPSEPLTARARRPCSRSPHAQQENADAQSRDVAESRTGLGVHAQPLAQPYSLPETLGRKQCQWLVLTAGCPGQTPRLWETLTTWEGPSCQRLSGGSPYRIQGGQQGDV